MHHCIAEGSIEGGYQLVEGSSIHGRDGQQLRSMFAPQAVAWVVGGRRAGELAGIASQRVEHFAVDRLPHVRRPRT